MKIETRYDVGHLFYVPRVLKRIKTETMMWEGREWERKVEYLEATVKQKEIIKIQVDYQKDYMPTISYYVVDKAEYEMLSQVYTENRITDYTYENALDIAETYRDTGIEYFGN